jgi:hypothetical protein
MIKRCEGNGFRMPTESELELAWRDKSATKYYTGNDALIALQLIGESKEAALQKPMTALPPNANGLFGCGVYAERVDTIVDFRGIAGKIGPGSVVKGGDQSPAPSAEMRPMPVPEIFINGIFRLALDDK